MGEESTTPVYIGKYEDGAVRFEPLGEFKVIDHDITDVYPDDMIKPKQYVRTIMRDQTITVQAFLNLKGLRGFYKAIGMPAYLRTEYLFPKKKKRGTARRKRKTKVYKQRFIKFINDKYGIGLIGTRATQPIIDDFFIPDDVLSPVDTDQAIPESEFDFVVTNSTFAGPFEGEGIEMKKLMIVLKYFAMSDEKVVVIENNPTRRFIFRAPASNVEYCEAIEEEDEEEE